MSCTYISPAWAHVHIHQLWAVRGVICCTTDCVDRRWLMLIYDNRKHGWLQQAVLVFSVRRAGVTGTIIVPIKLYGRLAHKEENNKLNVNEVDLRSYLYLVGGLAKAKSYCICYRKTSRTRHAWIVSYWGFWSRGERNDRRLRSSLFLELAVHKFPKRFYVCIRKRKDGEKEYSRDTLPGTVPVLLCRIVLRLEIMQILRALDFPGTQSKFGSRCIEVLWWNAPHPFSNLNPACGQKLLLLLGTSALSTHFRLY